MDQFNDFFSLGMFHDAWDAHRTNPATGLPMVGGNGSVDVAGNPYGCDLDNHQWDDNPAWPTGGFDSDPW
jgi:hypothetical protein